jgi:hypothetical protein
MAGWLRPPNRASQKVNAMSRNTTAEKDAEPLSDHFATESAYEFNRQIRECLIEAVNDALEQVAPVGRTPEEYHAKLRSYARHTLYGLITMNDIEGYGPNTLNEWLDDQITDRRLPANGQSDEWEMTTAREGWYEWETGESGYLHITEYEPGLWGLYHDTPESHDTDEWANQFTGTTKQVRKAIESIFGGEEIVLPDRVRQ